jgi:hypothetical protein
MEVFGREHNLSRHIEPDGRCPDFTRFFRARDHTLHTQVESLLHLPALFCSLLRLAASSSNVRPSSAIE